MALAEVHRRVMDVLLHGVTGERYKYPPLVVSCPVIVRGILPRECGKVKSVFATAGVTPVNFQEFMFLSLSALDIVEP